MWSLRFTAQEAKHFGDRVARHLVLFFWLLFISSLPTELYARLNIGDYHLFGWLAFTCITAWKFSMREMIYYLNAEGKYMP